MISSVNVCLCTRSYLHLSLSWLGVVGGAAEMLKYLNIFKNLTLVKLVFAVLTSHLLLEEILVFRVVHSKIQIKSDGGGMTGFS